MTPHELRLLKEEYPHLHAGYSLDVGIVTLYREPNTCMFMSFTPTRPVEEIARIFKVLDIQYVAW